MIALGTRQALPGSRPFRLRLRVRMLADPQVKASNRRNQIAADAKRFCATVVRDYLLHYVQYHLECPVSIPASDVHPDPHALQVVKKYVYSTDSPANLAVVKEAMKREASREPEAKDTKKPES